MSDSTRELPDRVLQFLLGIVTTPDDETIRERGDALRHEVAEFLVGSSDWQAALELLLTPTLAHLVRTPSLATGILVEAAHYLEQGYTKAPNAQSTGTVITTPAGSQLHPLETGIPEWLIERALAEESLSRSQFFASLKDWSVLTAFCKVLPHVRLSSADLITLTSTLYPFVARDMMAHVFYDAVKAWAARDPEPTIQVLNEWLASEPGSLPIPSTMVSVLFSGALSAQFAGWQQWRAQFVRNLDESSEQERWELAMHLDVAAWPAETPLLQTRIAALLARVRRLPGLLAAGGMAAARALSFDHPVDGLKAAFDIYRMGETRRQSEPARLEMVLLEVASIATGNASRLDVLVKDLSFVLDPLLDIPPESVDFRLDSVLHEFCASEKPTVRAFLQRWLRRHASAIRRMNFSLVEAFRMTWDSVRSERGGWLVSWMVSKDATLRAVAAHCVLRNEVRLAPPDWMPLSVAEAQAFVHEVVGRMAVTGALWIPTILDVAESRKDCGSTVREIMLTEAVLDLPGICAKEASARAESTVLGELMREVGAQLATLQQAYERRLAVPEVRGVTGASHVWARQFGRMMRVAHEEAQARSPLLSLVPKVPVARGDSSTSTPGGPQTRFATFSASFESPARSEIDRVQWELSRRMHLSKAASLLDAEAIKDA